MKFWILVVTQMAIVFLIMKFFTDYDPKRHQFWDWYWTWVATAVFATSVIYLAFFVEVT